ncbi:MAG: antibiotic transporter [Candidatus Protochlamydia sp.]|nr:antibiotic transporter [Candidatus Protochlamydia sp.]
MSLFSITLVLFLIMDPIGNIESYQSLVKELTPHRQNRIILREMLIALGVMLFFNYLGDFIFNYLHLSETTLRLSSGVILFLIAIKILFTAPDSLRSNLPKGEPFIFPVAVPLIAGPGLMATIMLYSHLEPSNSIMLFAILLAWSVSMVILFFSGKIQHLLGNNGLMACERLIGMVLVLISIQRFLEGILLFWATQPTPK